MSALTSTPQLIVTDRSGVERTIEAEDGLSVMEFRSLLRTNVAGPCRPRQGQRPTN
jgi:hypothetical protein